MEETKSITKFATKSSLCILDELGRGTSTHDGSIIAKSIIRYLAEDIGCRALFTTHYHNIIEYCQSQKGAALYFMDCLVDPNSKSIHFLYKFKQGICPESYGIHVAKLAGIDDEILKKAMLISSKFRKFNKLT